MGQVFAAGASVLFEGLPYTYSGSERRVLLDDNGQPAYELAHVLERPKGETDEAEAARKACWHWAKSIKVFGGEAAWCEDADAYVALLRAEIIRHLSVEPWRRMWYVAVGKALEASAVDDVGDGVWVWVDRLLPPPPLHCKDKWDPGQERRFKDEAEVASAWDAVRACTYDYRAPLAASEG